MLKKGQYWLTLPILHHRLTYDKHVIQHHRRVFLDQARYIYFDVFSWELLLDNKPQSPSMHKFKIEDTQFPSDLIIIYLSSLNDDPYCIIASKRLTQDGKIDDTQQRQSCYLQINVYFRFWLHKQYYRKHIEILFHHLNIIVTHNIHVHPVLLIHDILHDIYLS